MKPIAITRDAKKVLVLGAHCDDVEIGCGGTLVSIARARPDIMLHIVLFSGDAIRAAESRAAIARLLPEHSLFELEIYGFRDGFFPVDWAQIKERFEQLKRNCSPDLIFTHRDGDRHQDHRTVCELTWNTFRDHMILEYEIPKYDGDVGCPNVYVPLAEDVVKHKTQTLLECFVSQTSKRWFSEDLFRGLMRIRGMECNAVSGFAEAFYVRKCVVAW